MTFWIIAIAMSALVVLLLSRSLAKTSPLQDDRLDFDLQVYRDQLSEVDRDVARGVIAAEDAERIRTEISRRILAADSGRSAGDNKGAGPKPVAIGLIAVILIAGSLFLYAGFGQPGYGDLALQDRIDLADEIRANRPSQAKAIEGLPPFTPQEEFSPEFLALMDQLRETVAGRPDDLQGHKLLAQNEARMGNFSEAAAAQETVLRLLGEDVSGTDISDYAELLVLAAAGYVSPEAETAFRAAVTMDERDGRARYYLGLMMVQSGRPDIGFRLWDELLRRGPREATWIEPILNQIPAVAQLAGINYTIPAIGPGDQPGPSLADIEAAQELSAEDRMEMISGMVEGLSNRLAAEGGPPQDWARLITSLAVMGNPRQALAVYENAVEVFAEDPGAMDILRAAGSRAGVAE